MLHDDYDENEHSKESFAHLGLAIFNSQILEHQLVNMIVLLKLTQGLIPTADDFNSLFERKLSNTMGQLINEIKHLFQLNTEDILELKGILKLRNFIVHDYFKEKINLTFTRSGRNMIINDLVDFVRRVKEMDEKLVQYSNEIYQKLEITQEMLEDEIYKIKEIERNKEKNEEPESI